MELKSRLAAIINEVCGTDSGVTVENILSKYSITKRTLYYDLETINDWLKERNYGVVKVSNQCLFLISTKREDIKKELVDCQYYFSIEERKIFEFFFIALSSMPMNINYFQKYFDVSKNTVAADIRSLKETFETEEITIFSTAKQGYLLQGEEFAIRKKLGSYLSLLETKYPKEEIKRFFQQTLEVLIGKEFDFMEIARCLIKQYEIDINSQLYTGYLEYECSMILISWIRALKGNGFSVSVEEKDTLNITKSYASMVKNSQKLRFHGVSIPDNEVYYMTSLLLGIRTVQFSSQEQESLFIYHFVDQLISNFEKVACIRIKEKDHLAIRLRSHIRPFYYRLKYGLQEINVLTSQVKTMYPEAFFFCKMAIKDIDSDISEIISDGEIAYLTVYFVGTQTDHYNFHSDIIVRPKILVISEKGRAESDLLIEQLKDSLGNAFTFETTQYSKKVLSDLKEYSLVISTTKEEKLATDHPEKVIFVGSIIREEEFAQIINMLSFQGLNYRDDLLVNMIINDVKEQVTPNFNENKLFLAIFKSLRNFRHYQYKESQNHSFETLMKMRKYRYLQRESSWENILFEGYKGIYGEELTLIKLSEPHTINHQKNFLYNITDRIVLVYCHDYSHISEERVALIISRQKLAVTENHSGNIFIFFACQNNYDHFGYLKNIYDYCLNLDDEEIEQLLE